MQTYICKCGKTFKKSSNAESTGYILKDYSPYHECYGCPYIVTERSWETDEIIKRECRATPQITYATRCHIGTNDKDFTSCHLYSLDLVFVRRVLNFINSLEGAEKGYGNNCIPDEWRAADFGKCYAFKDCCGLAIFPLSFQKNAKGTEARRAVIKQFFTSDGRRRNLSKTAEKEIVLQRIQIAKENAAIKNSSSICSTCINNGECVSKTTDTCIAYEKATENTKEQLNMSLDLMQRYAERTTANSRHNNSELAEQYSSLWGSSTEDIVQIELSKIHSYQTPDGKTQPYRIQPKKVELLMVSIQDIGVLQPILVREKEPGYYEVLAGHHRFMAAQRTNRNCIPCIVKKDVDDITAYKIVAESNTPTEKVQPSENAVIFKYYMDNRTSGSEEGTVSEISKKFDVSETTVYRHIHLLSLNERLINAVDNSVIPFGRFEKLLSNLNADQQETLADYLEMYSVRSFNGKHINLLCTYLQKNSELTADEIDEIIHPEKEESKSDSSSDAENNTIYKKISDIFPDFSYTQTDLDDLIIKLLSEYMNTENDE